jgi:group I intron endonuclease
MNPEDTRKGYTYIITNNINGNWYIGSTVNPSGNRWTNHRCALRKGIHCNQKLQRSYDKYGEAVFSCGNDKEFNTISEAREYENKVIIENLGKNNFYNVSNNAKQTYVGSEGRVCSKETKDKMSQAQMASWDKRKSDPEYSPPTRIGHTIGQPLSESHRMSISEAHKKRGTKPPISKPNRGPYKKRSRTIGENKTRTIGDGETIPEL